MSGIVSEDRCLDFLWSDFCPCLDAMSRPYNKVKTLAATKNEPDQVGLDSQHDMRTCSIL